jgi:hypothetical protein
MIREQTGLGRNAHQLLHRFARAENGDIRKHSVRHRYLVAVVEARTDLAVFIDFVGQGSAVFHNKEASALKELGNAGEQADTAHTVTLGLFEQRLQ